MSIRKVFASKNNSNNRIKPNRLQDLLKYMVITEIQEKQDLIHIIQENKNQFSLIDDGILKPDVNLKNAELNMNLSVKYIQEQKYNDKIENLYSSVEFKKGSLLFNKTQDFNNLGAQSMYFEPKTNLLEFSKTMEQKKSESYIETNLKNQASTNLNLIKHDKTPSSYSQVPLERTTQQDNLFKKSTLLVASSISQFPQVISPSQSISVEAILANKHLQPLDKNLSHIHDNVMISNNFTDVVMDDQNLIKKSKSDNMKKSANYNNDKQKSFVNRDHNQVNPDQNDFESPEKDTKYNPYYTDQ